MKENKKVSIIPSAQLALFTGIAGLLANSIIESVEHNREVDLRKNDTINPNRTVAKNRKALPAKNVNTDEVAEEFVTENYAYLSPAGNPNVRYYLTQNVMIGRYPINDIIVEDETVSRIHCRIFLNDGKYYLVDLGAASPAKLNGTAVDNFRPANIRELYSFQLRHGDTITVGRTEYRFFEPETGSKKAPAARTNLNSTVIL